MEKNHMEILLEDISHKFELILEGHDVLSRKIDTFRDELNEKIEMITLAIKVLHQRVDENTKAIALLEQRVDALEQRVDENTKAIESLDKKIDSVAHDLKEHWMDTEIHRKRMRVSDRWKRRATTLRYLTHNI